MSLQILEHPSSSYTGRTYRNAREADLTVAIAMDFTTGGEKMTKQAAGEKYFAVTKEMLYPGRAVSDHIKTRPPGSVKVINIAGNGLYTLNLYKLNQSDVDRVMYGILRVVVNEHKIERVRCGGQTGIDLAGATAAYLLGIPVTVMMPKGFRQRDMLGIDHYHTEEQIREQIVKAAARLARIV